MTFQNQRAMLADDPGLGHALACMFHAPDKVHAACPVEWRSHTALLHTLIEDMGMTTAEAAQAARLPELTVAHYRAGVGI